MLEAAIHMGRSCISIECDGIYINMFLYFLSLDYQYAQSSRRLKEVSELAIAESAKPGMDYNK